MGVETAVCTGVTETAGAAGAVEAVETAAFGSNSAKPSPGVPMTQTFVRQGTSSPSWKKIASTVPSNFDSSSKVALSVS